MTGVNDNAAPGAVMGFTTTIKTLVDGTFRVQIDIQPSDAQAAFSLFGTPGTPVALARITPAAAQRQASKEFEQPERQKGGALCKLAAMWCAEEEFHAFLSHAMKWANSYSEPITSEVAANIIRETCGVASRADLDHNDVAAQIFHRDFRLPYQRWLQGARG